MTDWPGLDQDKPKMGPIHSRPTQSNPIASTPHQTGPETPNPIQPKHSLEWSTSTNQCQSTNVNQHQSVNII
eukprot:11180557-Lingulodinium_polyedra.AAC.1